MYLCQKQLLCYQEEKYLFQDYNSLLTLVGRDDVKHVTLISWNNGIIHLCIAASIQVVGSNPTHCCAN